MIVDDMETSLRRKCTEMEFISWSTYLSIFNYQFLRYSVVFKLDPTQPRIQDLGHNYIKIVLLLPHLYLKKPTVHSQQPHKDESPGQLNSATLSTSQRLSTNVTETLYQCHVPGGGRMPILGKSLNSQRDCC